MRWSRYYLSTAREAPNDAKTPGRQFLVRAGLIRRTGGSWSHLPLGCRSLAKLTTLIRRELDAAGALAVDLARDASITDLVRHDLRSYRQLPVTFYQVRDLQAGVWSFHPITASLDSIWRERLDLFGRIFGACRLPAVPVETFGGSLFLIAAGSGETAALRCPLCGYAATADKAEGWIAREQEEDPDAKLPAMREVATPGMKTVDDVARFLGVSPRRVVKTLLYETDQGLAAAVVRGDYEVNETKLAHVLRTSQLRLAGPEVVEAATGAPVGFAGPVGLPGVRLVADPAVSRLRGFVCGANRKDAHFVGVLWQRDLVGERSQQLPEMHTADLSLVTAGDGCPRCRTTLEAFRGFAVGEIGSSRAARFSFTDASGANSLLHLGSSSLETGHLLAAAVEQSHDADGILWPRLLAPFDVFLAALNPGDEAVKTAADQLYITLGNQGVEVLYDDRDERPGVKFKDADLLGFPVRLIVGGKSLAAGHVEVSTRRDREKQPVPVAEAVSKVLQLLEVCR